MKYQVLLLVFLSLSISYASAQNNHGAKLKFEEEVHDFGILKRGPVAPFTFKFTNTGDDALIIMGVSPSCGCTNVTWTKQPIPPGKTGEINLSLKTEEQHGIFNKEVYIQSNAINNPHGEKRYTLYIKGDARDANKMNTSKKKRK